MDAWLNRYGNDPVGEHVQRGFIQLSASMTVRELREKLRNESIKRLVDGETQYFYIVDGDDKLCGVLSFDRLNKAYCVETLRDIMYSDVFTIDPAMQVGPAVKMLYLSDLRGLPVVRDGKLIGVFTFDYLVDSIGMPPMYQSRNDAIKALREDLIGLLGFDNKAVRAASVAGAYRLRAPWLGVTTLAGLMCAAIIGRYDELFRQHPLVAAFLPLVLAIAESICHQASSLAIVDHLGARREWRKLGRALSKETKVSLLIGITFGALVALGFSLWTGDLKVARVVGLSVILAGGAGGVIGFAVTTGIRLCRKNPHVAGGPIALALTDAAAVLIFLRIAQWILM